MMSLSFKLVCEGTISILKLIRLRRSRLLNRNLALFSCDDFRHTLEFLNLAADADSFALVTLFWPTELRPVASPYENRKNLAWKRLV
jgi:hypothetical protein